MKQRFKKIKLVFCNHEIGKLAFEKEIQLQPPMGLINIANYTQQSLPNVDIEVIDGKLVTEQELLLKIGSDTELVGFSVWYSNYETTLDIIKKIKQQNSSVKVLLGGPYAAFLSEKMLKNNNTIDYAIKGDGEIAFCELVMGVSLNDINGLTYRKDEYIIDNGESKSIQNLSKIPIPDLSVLYPKYKWKGSPNSPAMTAFPVAGIRGCNRKDRCEYCSIPTIGYRTKNPIDYWNEINKLNEKYGIDYFFETGDVMTPKFINELAQVKDHANVAFRIYSFPGFLNNGTIDALKSIGVTTTFTGVESSLIWDGIFKRKYGNGYNINSLIHEIKMLIEAGIKTIPSFILGMENENQDSLNKTIDVIEQLNSISGIDEITISKIMPVPGSHYFNKCLSDSLIIDNYNRIANDNLLTTDKFDLMLLSKLFIERFTNIGYDKIHVVYRSMYKKIGNGLASWSQN